MSIKADLRCLKAFLSDYGKYGKYFADSSTAAENGDREARSILVSSHVVEKGLSHQQPKPLFGVKRVASIAEDLRQYIGKGGRDPFVISVGISAVERYNRFNSDLGVPEEQLIRLDETVLKQTHEPMKVGAYDMDKISFFTKASDPFSNLTIGRHSIRPYDTVSTAIQAKRIEKCIEKAMNCPSACNRQSVRVKVLLDTSAFAEVEKLQGGSTGFSRNCGALLIVSSDISLYLSSERKLPMIDSGIFIMNLSYALYEDKLGSCILNLELDAEREKKLREYASVPQNEMFAAMLAVTDLADQDIVRIPYSIKRNVKDIVRIV